MYFHGVPIVLMKVVNGVVRQIQNRCEEPLNESGPFPSIRVVFFAGTSLYQNSLAHNAVNDRTTGFLVHTSEAGKGLLCFLFSLFFS